MKHVKIVLSLLVVVVVFTGLVFFVEGFTTPQINDRLTTEANEAKFEVLPTLNDAFDLTYDIPNMVAGYDVTGTTIVGVYREEGHGYIYEAQFPSFRRGARRAGWSIHLRNRTRWYIPLRHRNTGQAQHPKLHAAALQPQPKRKSKSTATSG